MQIEIIDHEGNIHTADFRLIEEREDAQIGVATIAAEGETFRVPAIVYADRTVISASDWQGRRMDDDEIVAEAGDPAWAHHWSGPNGEAVVILDGLPRLLA